MAGDKMEGQMDFLGLIEEYTDDQGARVRVKSPTVKKPRISSAPDTAQFKLDFIDLDAEFEAEQADKADSLTEPVKPETEIKTDSVDKNEVKEDTQPSVAVKPVAVKAKIPKAVKEEKTKKADKDVAPTDILFKQCKRCWCRDCKHNSRNEGIPREMCGMTIPCPACNGCIEEDMATICEIGNAKEGCMFRAVEEGIFVPDEM